MAPTPSLDPVANSSGWKPCLFSPQRKSIVRAEMCHFDTFESPCRHLEADNVGVDVPA
jgi:hypothetical protein